jgi:hypothetical protein
VDALYFSIFLVCMLVPSSEFPRLSFVVRNN